MNVEPLRLRGAAILRSETISDNRGGFQRISDSGVLDAHGLDSRVTQVSRSSNRLRGTLRGMHYQVSPHEEAKTLWCSSGSVLDVLVDLRLDEPTYGTWTAVHLEAGDGQALHVPRGVAHGYQTLEDGTDLTYLISAPFVAASARTLLWSDPVVAIDWPLPVSVIAERDREAPGWPPRPH